MIASMEIQIVFRSLIGKGLNIRIQCFCGDCLRVAAPSRYTYTHAMSVMEESPPKNARLSEGLHLEILAFHPPL